MSSEPLDCADSMAAAWPPLSIFVMPSMASSVHCDISGDTPTVTLSSSVDDRPDACSVSDSPPAVRKLLAPMRPLTTGETSEYSYGALVWLKVTVPSKFLEPTTTRMEALLPSTYASMRLEVQLVGTNAARPSSQ